LADSSGAADGRDSDRDSDRDSGRDSDGGSRGGRDAAKGGGRDGDGAGGTGEAEADLVARVLSQWHQAYPSLDTAPLGVIGRLHRCAALLRNADDTPLAHEGLSRAEFDILGALRRAQHALTPGHIARETFASSAAVTKRIKELERRDLVVRRADDRDRRVVHLSLTESGRTLIDRLLPDQLSYEASLLAGLPAARQDELAGVLAQLLCLLERRVGEGRERSG
jgi:DNA-binding MarR family transcriptional regulator